MTEVKHLSKKLSLALLILNNIYNLPSFTINEEDLKLLSPSLGTAALICYYNPQYQDKKGRCKVNIFSQDREGNTIVIEGIVGVIKDGIDKNGFRDYIYGMITENGKRFGGVVGIKKPLHLCDKDGWWVEQVGVSGYRAILCEDGKPVRTYETVFTGVDTATTSDYSSRLYIFDTPNRDFGVSAPDFLYNVAIRDQMCADVVGKNPLPLDIVQKRIKEKCGSPYFYLCVKNSGKAVCYPRTDPSAEPEAAALAGY